MGDKRPNFLIFMTDQQAGFSQMAESGVHMPNLERLKASGVSFDNAYCPSPHCCPSRASFFTGLYPSQHGVWNNVDLAGALSHSPYDGVTMFSQELSASGYQMYYSGKWHVSAQFGPGSVGFRDGLYPEDSVKLPDSFEDLMEDKPGLYRRTRDRFGLLSRAEQEEALRHYYGFCSYEDALFGRLLDMLEARNLLGDTIVFYLSDHGDYAGAHGLWTKGLPCFEEAYHICSVAGYGGIQAAGNRVKEPLCLVEVWRDAVYTQTNGNECYGIQRSVFTDEYHFVFNEFDYDELYDRKKDPDCTKNLARHKEYEPVIRSMYERLWRFGYEHWDHLGDPYITTALAQYGPGIMRAGTPSR